MPLQPVPYESGLSGEGLAPGKSLLIFAAPEKKAKRFHINLLKKNGDIALHFNPRFDEKACLHFFTFAHRKYSEFKVFVIHIFLLILKPSEVERGHEIENRTVRNFSFFSPSGFIEMFYQ